MSTSRDHWHRLRQRKIIVDRTRTRRSCCRHSRSTDRRDPGPDAGLRVSPTFSSRSRSPLWWIASIGNHFAVADVSPNTELTSHNPVASHKWNSQQIVLNYFRLRLRGWSANVTRLHWSCQYWYLSDWLDDDAPCTPIGQYSARMIEHRMHTKRAIQCKNDRISSSLLH